MYNHCLRRTDHGKNFGKGSVRRIRMPSPLPLVDTHPPDGRPLFSVVERHPPPLSFGDHVAATWFTVARTAQVPPTVGGTEPRGREEGRRDGGREYTPLPSPAAEVNALEESRLGVA